MQSLVRKVSMNFLSLLLFSVLMIIFLVPTLSFLISFFEIAPLSTLITLFEWFGVAAPFIILISFFAVLKASGSKFADQTSMVSRLQAILALVIFAIWFERGFIHVSGYLPPLPSFVVEVSYLFFVVALYATFFVFIWKTARRRELIGVKKRFEALYLWVNLVFVISIPAHLVNRIDLVYYFGFHMPGELSWLFGYTPTVLVSTACLLGWFLYLRNAKKRSGVLLSHFALVLLPVLFVVVVDTYNPLIGYVITSMIVWGTSYEFFRPPVLSLSLVLSAIGGFLSFVILLNSKGKPRNRNYIELGLASAVLSGISQSLVSVLGVLAALYVLLHGFLPSKEEK